MVDSEIIRMMIYVSAIVGISILIVVLWGVKGGQFDDPKKMMEGSLYDSEDDLNEAIKAEKKQKAQEKKSEDKES
jgi:cbb3-type cytochrome oxidase maturation protein